MEKLRPDHGVATIERALRYMAIRVTSRPETREMASELRAERARLKDADEMWLEARETRIAATAEVEYLDERLGSDVMSVCRAALALVKDGNREDERYKRLIGPVSPSEALVPVGGEEQTRFVRTFIAQLTSEGGPFPELADRAPVVQASLTALNEAEARRNALYVPEGTAAAERTAARDRARRLYNLMHPRLQLAFPDDERLVESFFAKIAAPRKKPAEAVEDEGEEEA
jgi:hypothetical protein